MTKQPSNLLSAFLEWGKNLKSRLESGSIIEINLGSPSAKQSGWIDLENHEFMTRIVLWDSGEYDYETIEVESGNYIDQMSGSDIEESQFEQLFGPSLRRYMP